MDGISAQLLKEIRQILLNCGPFFSDRQLSDTFVDERIAPWKNLIPQGENPAQRMESLVSLLSSRYNKHQENALVLFLQVVCDQTHEMDICHGQLTELIGRLQPASHTSSPSAQSDTPSTKAKLNLPELNRFQLYNILIEKFDLKELNNLAFFLNISLEDIPGGTRDGKIRELIQYAERHSRFEELVQKMGEIHPEAFDDYR